jgi:hypothetical protein
MKAAAPALVATWLRSLQGTRTTGGSQVFQTVSLRYLRPERRGQDASITPRGHNSDFRAVVLQANDEYAIEIQPGRSEHPGPRSAAFRTMYQNSSVSPRHWRNENELTLRHSTEGCKSTMTENSNMSALMQSSPCLCAFIILSHFLSDPSSSASCTSAALSIRC